MSVTTSSENTTVKKVKERSYQQVKVNGGPIYLMSKRIMDIVCALLGIILLSPLFLVVALLIKIEDRKGPIFFHQVRVGKNGAMFTIHKFRSMVSNAEELKATLLEQNEVIGPVFKMKNDPRVTRIGRFIRKTSVDELPQLFNVLKGEMSLVGPRPPLLDEVQQYTNYERQRLNVVPGLTCYWQVSGRSNLGFDEWMRLDLKYIDERNFFIDIRLIFKTVLVLFGTKDAF